jgi:hypothetical protein
MVALAVLSRRLARAHLARLLGCAVTANPAWVSGCYGSSALVAPCGWVMAFPVPDDFGEADR